MGYYKELPRRLRRRYLDSLRNVVLQNPADVYSDCNQAADLLARAEAAEARAEKAERCIAEIKAARDHTRPAYVVDKILEDWESQKEG